MGVEGGFVSAHIEEQSARCALGTLLQAVEELRGIRLGVLSNPTRMRILEAFEAVSRALPGIGHEVINLMSEQAAGVEMGAGTTIDLIAGRLRLDRADAKRRVAAAGQLGPRTTVTGDVLAPVLARTGAAQRAGRIGGEHVAAIRTFFAQLPTDIDAGQRDTSEKILVELACHAGPAEVTKAAERLLAMLHPDGSPGDERDRARKAYFRIGRQGPDKMSKGSFCVDPETRALLEALFAKLARPGTDTNTDDNEDHAAAEDTGRSGGSGSGAGGSASSSGSGGSGAEGGTDGDADADTAAHPDGDTDEADAAGTDGSDSDNGTDSDDDRAAATGTAGSDTDAFGSGSDSDATAATGSDNDTDATAPGARSRPAPGRYTRPDPRTQEQRNHDALKEGLQRLLGSGRLGTHRGLPATVVVTMRLSDLENACGHALTGGGTVLPMRDALRIATNAHHYLAIFDDDGRPLHLSRAKRLATADQRLVLYAKDRGCTFPGCPHPGYYAQTHHVDEWADGGGTDVHRLTFACDAHHHLVGDGPTRWATTITGPDDPYPHRTAWHPPAFLDPQRNGKINHYHHPDELLLGPTEPDRPLHQPQQQ